MQNYSVKVDVHEARDVVFFDPSTESEVIPQLFVKVITCGTYQQTPVKQESSSSIFKCSFNFNSNLDKTEFERNRIVFEVHHSYRIYTHLIGVHAFGFPLIYSKPQHCVHRSWVQIISPTHPSKSKGYLLVSVGIFGPGDHVPVFKDSSMISEASRFRRELDLQPTLYVLNVNIHRGEDIKFAIGSSNEQCIRVRYGGMEGLTPKTVGNPNPEWQTGVYIPCLTPNYDGLVTIDVLNRSDELVYSQNLDFASLLKKSVKGKWINIFYGPNNTNFFSSITGYIDTLHQETDYGGRILISSSLTQVQTLPPLGTRFCKSIPDPPAKQCAVWVDIYEAIPLCDASEIIRISCSFGPNTIYSDLLELTKDKNYMVTDQAGRLEEIVTLLSESCDNPWDVFVYCIVPIDPYRVDGGTRIAWQRIPFQEAFDSEFRPKWYQLSSFTSGEPDKISVLMSITIKNITATSRRPERLGYNISRFIFRAMIYEALRVPLASQSYPDPYVNVELGRYTIQTNVARQTTNPSYYQSFELEIMLPENLFLAPDIKLQIYNDTGGSGDNLLCTGMFPLDQVPLEWSKAPKWVDMTTNGPCIGNPKILIAFELLPLEVYQENPERFEFFDDIRPTVYPSLVSLLLVGIRMFHPVEEPRVLTSFGQHSGINEDSGLASSGSGPCWNFLRNFDFQLNLPKRMQHHVQLEFTVMDNDTRIGIGQVSLNPLFPWLDEEEKRECIEIFKPFDFSTQNEGDNKVNDIVKIGASPLPSDDIDCLNVRLDESIEHTCLEKKGFDKRKTTSRINTMRTLNSMYGLVDRTGTIVGNSLANNSLEFDLEVEDSRGMERDEIPYEYECDINDDELPYFRVPIFKCKSNGDPETIGFFKYYCSVVQLANSTGHMNERVTLKRVEKERMKMEKKRSDIMRAYDAATNLIVRAYILEAKGLCASSGNRDISSYIWIRSNEYDKEKVAGHPRSVNDSTNVKNQGFNPEFNTCYRLGCSLPDDAILKISVMSKGSLTDEEIGTTIVDIEDRYFSKIVSKMFEQDAIPIELRTLKLLGSSVSHGTLRGWYEIMDSLESRKRPVKVLTNYDSQEYEMRVVIWDVKNVILKDTTSISMFVRGIYQQENETLEQDTDVHYNSKDGSGIFNWRFIFGFKIPTEYTVLNLQIRSYTVIQSYELIGQVSIDLSSDFQKVRKANGPYWIPKMWVDCTHPSYGTDVRGKIQIEVSIIPLADAQIFPVGEGRKEPNKDPYLPPVLENRDFMGWKGVVESIGYATDAIMSGLKWTGIWVSIAGAIATILFLIVLFK